MGGIDFSGNKLMEAHPRSQIKAMVKKGESQGVLKDGRICSFITVGLARLVIAVPRYLKGRDSDRRSLLDVLEVFDTGSTSKEKQAAADKKIEDFVKPPESALDGMAAVNAVGMAEGIKDNGDPGFSVTPTDLSLKQVETWTVMFQKLPLTVVVVENQTSWQRAAFVPFLQLCAAIGLNADKSLMGISNVLNTSIAPAWGMELINMQTKNKAGVHTCPWISLDSVYSWLATYDAYMKRLDPKFDCEEQKPLMELYQVALKEACWKFIEPAMRGVAPKADENKAGVKPPAGAPDFAEPGEVKEEAFDKKKFIDQVRSPYLKTETKVPKAEIKPEPTVVETVEAEQQFALEAEGMADDDDLFTKSLQPVFLTAERVAWKTVSFDGFSIAVLEADNENWASISRICKDLGIDKGRQLKKLQDDPTFRCGHMSTPDNRNVLQVHICLTTRDLFRWLDGIGMGRIGDESAVKVASYKAGLMKVLVDHEVQRQAPVPAAVNVEIRMLMEAVKASLEGNRMILEANSRLALESQERVVAVADRAVEVSNGLVDKINAQSIEVVKARAEAAEKDQLAKVKEEEARFARLEEVRANKAKDNAEITLNQVMQDYQPALEKGKAFDELVYDGPSKNITTIAHECGLGSGTELNRILVERGMIIKHRRYPNTWEPSAKMMRMVPIGTKLGCIELVNKGNDQTLPVFGHSTTVQCWAWMPAGELLIKRIVREYLEEVGQETLKKDEPAVPCVKDGLVSGPPQTPFPGSTVQPVFGFEAVTGKMPV